MRVLIRSVPCDPLRLPPVAGKEVKDLAGGEGGVFDERSEKAGIVDQDVWGVGDQFCGGQWVGPDFDFAGRGHGAVDAFLYLERE